MLPQSMYGYIWNTSRAGQIRIGQSAHAARRAAACSSSLIMGRLKQRPDDLNDRRNDARNARALCREFSTAFAGSDLTCG